MNPLTITATVPAWFSVPTSDYMRRELDRSIELEDAIAIVNALTFYRSCEGNAPAGWIRMGEADITVRLISKDEQTQQAVAALNAKLDDLRAAYLTKQQEIMRQISELQAITNEVAA